MAMSDGFWLGVLGGLFAEVFSLSKLRYLPRDARPLWVLSVWYWAITLAMILSGGALVAIYLGSGVTMTPLLAVNIGACPMSRRPPIRRARAPLSAWPA